MGFLPPCFCAAALSNRRQTSGRSLLFLFCPDLKHMTILIKMAWTPGLLCEQHCIRVIHQPRPRREAVISQTRQSSSLEAIQERLDSVFCFEMLVPCCMNATIRPRMSCRIARALSPEGTSRNDCFLILEALKVKCKRWLMDKNALRMFEPTWIDSVGTLLHLLA